MTNCDTNFLEQCLLNYCSVTNPSYFILGIQQKVYFLPQSQVINIAKKKGSVQENKKWELSTRNVIVSLNDLYSIKDLSTFSTISGSRNHTISTVFGSTVSQETQPCEHNSPAAAEWPHLQLSCNTW